MENREELRKFIISLIKRFQLDFELLEKIVDENKQAFDEASKSSNDFLLQCQKARNDLQAMLDYNFFEEETKDVLPYTVEVLLVKNGDMV